MKDLHYYRGYKNSRKTKVLYPFKRKVGYIQHGIKITIYIDNY